MTVKSLRINEVRLHSFSWLVVYITYVAFLMPLPGFSFFKSVIVALASVAFFAVIIYGNVKWLIPVLFEKRRYITYGMAVVILIECATGIKVFLNYWIRNRYYNEPQFDFSFLQWGGNLFTGTMVFFVSWLFYGAVRFFRLQRKQDIIELQRYKAELSLLKAQVQPHFLFNTLNNIYFEAQAAPKAARLIERLAALMRYFVDENLKERVLLENELEFINHYIELERVRLRTSLNLEFEKSVDLKTSIPPMLMMPLVENLFKHGINKDIESNTVTMRLKTSGHELTFFIENDLHPELKQPQGGFGLQNLRRRLEMLYGENFRLDTGAVGNKYKAQLTIPIT